MIIIKAYIRLFSVILAVVLSLSLVSCDDGDEIQQIPEADKTVLNVGCGAIGGTFNPFYATEDSDVDACSLVFTPLFESERGGSIVFNGRTISYQNSEYTYESVAGCVMTDNADITVTYYITLRDNIYFSDGEKMTADDVIFTMYVLADPAYDGPSTFSSVPIVGMSEYREGMFVLADMLSSVGEDNQDFTHWTREQQQLYWDTLKGAAGEQFAQEIIDYYIDNGLATDVAGAMKKSGYSHRVVEGTEYTAADFFRIICEEYDYDYNLLGYEAGVGGNLFEITEELLCEVDPVYGTSIAVGQSEPVISGIKKTGELSLSVTTEYFDSATAYALAFNVAPLHYYGDESMFDPDAGQFGFVKGDLTGIKQVQTPVGAGAYKFVKNDGNKISFAANENYYKGAAKIPEVAFISYASSDEMVAAVESGQLDICSPELSSGTIDTIKAINGNGELSGEKITYLPVDFNGYGFIGINSANVQVNGAADSEQSIYLRKAFATLFAAYRNDSVADYYGELAQVIEYPVSATSWAAPAETDEGYRETYSVAYDGSEIYTEGMSAEQRYDAALAAAVDYFTMAGYEWDHGQSRFTAAPTGARMSYTIIVPGSGTGDHPCYYLAEKVSEVLAGIGIQLVVEDPVDTNRLWAALNSGTQDMWCAAWSGSVDPDLYKVYYSANYPGNIYGTGKNHFYISDSDLDSLIIRARSMDDTELRRELYLDCFNIILDWSVEVPTYQRQQAYIYSTERINIESLPKQMTPYRTWLADIESIELQ